MSLPRVTVTTLYYQCYDMRGFSRIRHFLLFVTPSDPSPDGTGHLMT